MSRRKDLVRVIIDLVGLDVVTIAFLAFGIALVSRAPTAARGATGRSLLVLEQGSVLNYEFFLNCFHTERLARHGPFHNDLMTFYKICSVIISSRSLMILSRSL